MKPPGARVGAARGIPWQPHPALSLQWFTLEAEVPVQRSLHLWEGGSRKSASLVCRESNFKEDLLWYLGVGTFSALSNLSYF